MTPAQSPWAASEAPKPIPAPVEPDTDASALLMARAQRMGLSGWQARAYVRRNLSLIGGE